MARKKISEYTAKRILTATLALPYQGISFSSLDDKETLANLDKKQTYVVKVDEGVKKRMKQGLVLLDVPANHVEKASKELFTKGYQHVIIEPFLKHANASEHYLSLERTREGIALLYSDKGGIDIEDNADSIKHVLVTKETALGATALQIGVPEKFLEQLLAAFTTYHFSFLEINPLVIQNETISLLDVAAQVDSAGLFFAQHAWDEEDFRTAQTREKTDEEKQIALLSDKSQASLTLEVLNPDGSIFMLLSGGGASIVLADEGYNLGYGKELANYGEFSGNPNAEEVYLYTRNLLSLLLKSKARKKVLIIAGGVANFTDIRITFIGLVKALAEVSEKLYKQNVKVFVRRGGPHQEEGLARMEAFLKKENIYGFVGDQTTSLPEIVKMALEEVK